MFTKALTAPISRIISNATGSEDVNYYLNQISQQSVIKEPIFGFNANTCEIVDMLEANIIDPYEVVKYSVLDAVAVVGVWLTTDTAVINLRKDATEAMREVLLGNIT